MFRISIILLIGSFLLSCNRDLDKKVVCYENVIKFNGFPKEESISFSNVFEYINGVPRSIHVLDSLLVIANQSGEAEYFFYLFSLDESKLSDGLVKKGRGPNEAIGISTTGVFKDILWAYDVTLKKCIFTNISNLKNTNGNVPLSSYKIDEQYFKMVLSDSMKVYAVSQFNERNCKVEIIDLLIGKRIGEIGKYPKIPADLHIQSVKDAYASEICIKPSGGKIALARNFSDAVEIYNLNNSSCKTLQGPEVFNVAFKEKRRKDHFYMGKTRETRSAFINITASDKYINLLYSGHRRQNRTEEDRHKWSNGSEIFVYDWDGNPVKKLKLDRHIHALGVSSDDRNIYSYDLNTGFIIKAEL